MNALIAVFCTIGAIALIGVIVSVIEEHGEGIGLVGCALVFLVLPVVLSIWGLIVGNLGIMILGEVIAFVGSLGMAQNSSDSLTWINFVPLLPAILLLIACIVGDIVWGAVVMVLIGGAQLGLVVH